MPFYHGLKCYTDDPDKGDYPGKSDWIARRLLALRYDLGEKIVNDRRPGSLKAFTTSPRSSRPSTSARCRK